MKTIFILVDALRSDYLNKLNMPYLSWLAEKSIYVKEVYPSFGFCERTEIFTGMTPDISENLTAIGYDPGRSEYSKFKYLLPIFDLMEKINRYYARKVSARLFSLLNISMQIYEIPFRSLSNYALTEDGKELSEYNAFNNESIFDVAKKEYKNISLSAFTSMRSQNAYSTIRQKIEYIKSCSDFDIDCALMYIGDIDKYGHLYADSIQKMQPYLSAVDNAIKEIHAHFIQKGCPFTFVVLGDHGMVPVYDNINIYKIIKDEKLKISRDYEMFLDSTIARFWFFEKKTKQTILSALNEKAQNKGFIVNREDSQRLNIPINAKNSEGKRLYGDLMWCAFPGVLIYPDYFNRNENLHGMHGYAENTKMGSGLLVVGGSGIKPNTYEQCRLVDVCPTLCDIINIRYPNANTGRSLIAK